MNIANIVLFLMCTISTLVFQCLLPLKYIGFGYRLKVYTNDAITGIGIGFEMLDVFIIFNCN